MGAKMRKLSGRHCEIEGRAFSGLGFDPDFAAVALDNFFANSQAYSLAGILFNWVKLLENKEDSFM